MTAHLGGANLDGAGRALSDLGVWGASDEGDVGAGVETAGGVAVCLDLDGGLGAGCDVGGDVEVADAEGAEAGC
jgi:hypothetical protein